MLKFGFNSGLPSISADHIYTGAMLPATETYRLKDRGNTKYHLPVNSGAAIQFNGADQYLLTSGLPDQDTWTFAFWYKHLAASDAILAGVIDTETNSRAYIGINLAGKLGVGVNGNTYNDAGYFVEGLEVGTWYPVVFSKNVDDWSLHVDGQKLAGSEPGWTTPQGPIAIGAIYRSSDGTVTNQIAAAMSNIMFVNGTSFSDGQAAFYASYPERTFAHFNASDDHAESVFSGLTCNLLLNHGTYGEAMDYSFDRTDGLTTFSTTNATVTITFSAPAGEGLYINGTYYEGQGYIDVNATESAAGGVVDIEESYDGALTKITATSQGLSGTVPDLSLNTQLTHVNFNDNNLSGQVPDLSLNTQLLHVNLSRDNLSGQVPDLSLNTQLLYVNFADNNLSGTVPDLSLNTQLLYANFGGNNLSGQVPDLSSNTQLTNIYFGGNNLSGQVPDLSSNTQLTNTYFNSNNFTDFAGGVINVSDVFRADNNSLMATAIDNILQALVDGSTTGPADIVLDGGANEAPSSAGEAHIDTLRSRGCTVTVTGGY